ncbi:DUF423 domain-containing protein [Caryophanon tenue]|uniref:DUF423 domain-containing protein n=1 Tax=Caryophanon tenue TaxID=33978 RepID=A0A1C0Y6T7_9BACL|nr:DUF423 domain-containing protein [Caryophanon tenue]OCS82872.1 hypothetical protein A6M13_05585 [Caryophanon tenue]
MLIIGAVLAFLAVALGAFGAHALKGKFAEARYEKTWETGTQYHMYHALAILLVGVLLNDSLLGDREQLMWAGYCFIAGIVFFSGSLYVLSVTGIKKLGAITPIGGVFFLAGWVLVALAAMS